MNAINDEQKLRSLVFFIGEKATDVSCFFSFRLLSTKLTHPCKECGMKPLRGSRQMGPLDTSAASKISTCLATQRKGTGGLGQGTKME